MTTTVFAGYNRTYTPQQPPQYTSIPTRDSLTHTARPTWCSTVVPTRFLGFSVSKSNCSRNPATDNARRGATKQALAALKSEGRISGAAIGAGSLLLEDRKRNQTSVTMFRM